MLTARPFDLLPQRYVFRNDHVTKAFLDKWARVAIQKAPHTETRTQGDTLRCSLPWGESTQHDVALSIRILGLL